MHWGSPLGDPFSLTVWGIIFQRALGYVFWHGIDKLSECKLIIKKQRDGNTIESIKVYNL